MPKSHFLKLALVALGLGLLASWTVVAQTPAPSAAKAERLDGQGDPLPTEAQARLGTLRWRHGPVVLFVAYTANGKELITASQDGTVRVWEADTGKEIRRFGKTQPATHQVTDALLNRGFIGYPLTSSAATLSPDGNILALSAQDGTIALWDVATGKELRSWKTNPAMGVFSLHFAPDGKSLVAKCYNQVLFHYNAADGKELRKFTHQSTPQKQEQLFYGGNQQTGGVAILDDGKVLAVAAIAYANNQVAPLLKRWDLESGKELEVLKGPAGNAGCHSLAVAPDGKSIAWAMGDGTVRLWDVAANKEARQFGNPQQGGFTNGMTFSPDGKTLATRGQDGLLRLWDPATGKQTKVLSGPEDGPNAAQRAAQRTAGASNLAFAPDGKRLALGTHTSIVRQWDTTTGKEIAEAAGHQGMVLTVALAADGKTAATCAADNTLHVWNTATGKQTRRIELPVLVTHAAFSADGQTIALAATDGTLRTYDTGTGKELQQWKAWSLGFLSLALSPDGKTVAIRGYDMVIRLFEAVTGKELKQIAAAPATDRSGGVEIGQVKVVARARLLYDPGVPTLIFSPDGTMLAASCGDPYGNRHGQNVIQAPVAVGNNAISLWDVRTGRLLRRFEAPPVAMRTFTFSADGRTIAAANNDGTVSLWETASGKQRFQFKALPNGGAINNLAYSPDGCLLVGAGPDLVIRFWDAATGKERKQLSGHQSPLSALAFAADGKTLLTGSHDTTALVWDVADVKPEPRPQNIELKDDEAESLWTILAGEDAKKAYEAVRKLSSAPGQAVPLVQKRVQPVPAPEGVKIKQLLVDLDSNQFAVRQKATEELEKFGNLVEPDLKDMLAAQPSLELRMRIDRLLARLTNVAPPTADEVRAMRALEVLEQLGSAEAKAAVETLAKGAAWAQLTKLAQRAVERMNKR